MKIEFSDFLGIVIWVCVIYAFLKAVVFDTIRERRDFNKKLEEAFKLFHEAYPDKQVRKRCVDCKYCKVGLNWPLSRYGRFVNVAERYPEYCKKLPKRKLHSYGAHGYWRVDSYEQRCLAIFPTDVEWEPANYVSRSRRFVRTRN